MKAHPDERASKAKMAEAYEVLWNPGTPFPLSPSYFILIRFYIRRPNRRFDAGEDLNDSYGRC
jgi:hypothetical protein